MDTRFLAAWLTLSFLLMVATSSFAVRIPRSIFRVDDSFETIAVNPSRTMAQQNNADEQSSGVNERSNFYDNSSPECHHGTSCHHGHRRRNNHGHRSRHHNGHMHGHNCMHMRRGHMNNRGDRMGHYQDGMRGSNDDGSTRHGHNGMRQHMFRETERRPRDQLENSGAQRGQVRNHH